ncbi:MAG: hypothetical protein MJ002_05675 [Paludibacteraceae bacterium]|nr:hypothetical protein [Paludibacteraceae bacterium]
METMPFEEDRNAVFAKLAETAARANLTKEERARYDEQWRNYNDYYNTIDFAKEEGQETERIKIAKALKAKGISVQMISECTGLTEEKITEL